MKFKTIYMELKLNESILKNAVYRPKKWYVT